MLGHTARLETLRLPPPSRPSRPGLPETSNLLRFHGFDTSFDQKLTRAADSITSSLKGQETWLHRALEECARLSPLSQFPCGRVRVSKKLGAEGYQEAEEPRRVAEALANVSPRAPLEASDITMGISPASEDGTFLVLEFCLRSSTSLRGAVEALTEAVNDKKMAVELNEALVEVGADPAAVVQVTPVWPLERVQEQLRLAFPEYTLSAETVERLMAEVDSSWAAHAEDWKALMMDFAADLTALVGRRTQERFEGQLLAHSQGRGERLRRDFSEHGANDLFEVMADAVQAQRLLKEALAPGTDWSRTRLNDPLQVPEGSEVRLWRSGPSDPAPNGLHVDPGIRDQHSTYEDAKQRQKPYMDRPLLSDVLDLSRLSITFATPADLDHAVERLTERFEVLTIRNGFRNPHCEGSREVVISVRQDVPVEGDPQVTSRVHVSEFRLTLQSLRDAAEASRRQRLQAMALVLKAAGVQKKDRHGVIRLLLEGLDATLGRESDAAEKELLQAIRHACSADVQLEHQEVQELAVLLVDAMSDVTEQQGVDIERVSQMLEAMPTLRLRRILRKERTYVQGQLARLLAAYDGVSLDGDLAKVCGGMGSLPRDREGLVCLQPGVPPLGEISQVSCAAPEAETLEEARARAAALNVREAEAAHQGETVTPFGHPLRMASTLVAGNRVVHAAVALLENRHKAPMGGKAQAGLAQALAASVGDPLQAACTRESGKVDVPEFLRAFPQHASQLHTWVLFEDQLHGVVSAGAGGSPGLQQVGAMLASRSRVEADCFGAWQVHGAKLAAGRLKNKEPEALPGARLLLEFARCEVKASVAYALTSASEKKGSDWVVKVAEEGLVAPLVGMLDEGPLPPSRPQPDEDCCCAAATALLRMASNPQCRQHVSDAKPIKNLANVCRGKRGSTAAAGVAAQVLQVLAKGSFSDAEEVKAEKVL
mmetsp:Transcript_11277/g.24758  ORF Transcript_11277/g.24758 Transcript_11277/m.24758 type:complete len:940 (+) Transcript_11277:44-2863(+)